MEEKPLQSMWYVFNSSLGWLGERLELLSSTGIELTVKRFSHPGQLLQVIIDEVGGVSG